MFRTIEMSSAVFMVMYLNITLHMFLQSTMTSKPTKVFKSSKLGTRVCYSKAQSKMKTENEISTVHLLYHFQYLTDSVNSNSTTLVKVIAAVLKFSPQQTQVVLEKEAQRHSLVSIKLIYCYLLNFGVLIKCRLLISLIYMTLSI
jgi:hypothetical protein